MDTRCDRLAVALGEQAHHLFDLQDLFGRAAEEAEQGLSEWLAQQPQMGKRRLAARQMRIASPGQAVHPAGPILVEGKVPVHGRRRVACVRRHRAPFEGSRRVPADLGEGVAPAPAPDSRAPSGRTTGTPVRRRESPPTWSRRGRTTEERRSTGPGGEDRHDLRAEQAGDDPAIRDVRYREAAKRGLGAAASCWQCSAKAGSSQQGASAPRPRFAPPRGKQRTLRLPLEVASRRPRRDLRSRLRRPLFHATPIPAGSATPPPTEADPKRAQVGARDLRAAQARILAREVG
jgi:hypothetical protein